MKLAGDYRFEAAVTDVWAALFDPAILAAVLPGCEKLELVDGKYVGEMKIKVGPISGKFTGKVDLVDLDEPRGYRMVIDGRGAPGFVNANATVKLEPEDVATRIRYEADAQVGGKLAGVGQRLIEASTRAIVAQALEGLHTNIKLRAEAYRAAKPPEPVSVSEPVSESVSVPVPVPDPVPVPLAASAPSPVAPVVTFTPVKLDQSALAAGVAKEVFASIFSRTVLAVIIALQFAVILWLLLR